MYCRCSREIKDNEKFCENCGTRLEQFIHPETSSEKNNKKI